MENRICGETESGTSESLLDLSLLHLLLPCACADLRIADVANLLLTSKTVHSAVLASCKGLLSVTRPPARADNDVQPFTRWLAKYGMLVGRLNIWGVVPKTAPSTGAEADEELEKWLAIEHALAVSLQQAARSSNSLSPGNGLYISGCSLWMLRKGMAAVLEQLPSSRLTQLDSIILHPPWMTEEPNDYLSHLSSSLSHLTNLRKLKLVSYRGWTVESGLDPLMLQLSRLTNLTHLALSKVTGEAPLESLPPSLKDLEFSFDDSATIMQLDLGHLTALTCLGRHGTAPKLPKDCILPTSIVKLCGCDLIDAACLMPLQHLQELELDQCSNNGSHANLQPLGSLAALTRVTLKCGHLKAPDISGWFWKTILKDLSISIFIDADALSHIGQLAQLSRLELKRCSIACSPATFATVLKELRSLQDLEIECPRKGTNIFVQADDVDEKSSALHSFGALTSLLHLQRLVVKGLAISQEAAMQLASGAAGQLTKLEVRDCCLNNSSLCALLPRCTQLVYLDVSENCGLNDEVLPVVATLPHLRIFWYAATGITEAGCTQHLRNVAYFA